ncbi:MAG TPA: erythromycin esterase family protein [Rubricoccaceae bacterium]|jgi:protein-L-isoaspartate(D-aspartate) O-methyltransferase
MSRLPARPRPADAGAEVHRTPDEAARLVAEHAEPFASVDAFDPGPMLDRIGDARVVCIGEATHGTSEFYRLRARITQALIEQKEFQIVAVEADWADAERIDAYVRHREPGETERDAFGRFPTWMWRNEEVRDFVEWLRERNDGRGEADRAGFFGLDLYGLYESLHEVLRYLDETDPDLAADARLRYGCLMPFEGDPADYGRALARTRYDGCEKGVVEMLRDLLRKRLTATAGAHGTNDFPFFNATENARVVADAEAYYRESFVGSANTWNLRDTHMVATLQSLMEHVGPDARAVVWAHNSHVGDAAATQMGHQGDINVGHLCRQAFGDDAYLIGFGTHTGTVFAADGWGDAGHVKAVRPSHPDSVEGLAHASGVERFTLPLRHAAPDLRDEMGGPRLERAIGVIYRPETELQSHYFAADLPGQFDEWVWVDETSAVTPLGPSHAPTLPTAHPFRLLAD